MSQLADLSTDELIRELRERRADMRAAHYPPIRCEDCATVSEHYMVKPEVWAIAWPGYKEERLRRRLQWRHDGTGPFFCLLCFTCLEKRLGRRLTPNDFDLSLPINMPIAFGMRLGAT